jgi:EmrB/QacA subfamily drug resistance transporter
MSEHAPAASPTPEPAPLASRWLGLSGICLGVFMFTLDASIVNVAMPTFVKAFGTTFSAVQWVVLIYLLIATALVMAAAWLGDVYGRRRAYLFGLAVFTFGSTLCGLAPTIGWLIAFRSVQGLGAVFVSALGAAIVGEMFPPQQRGKALGMIGSAVLLGVAIGPSVGGIIIDVAGWRWMFFVNIPVGFVAMTVVYRFVPDIPSRSATARFDWTGTVLAAAMLSSLALGLTWGQRDGFGAWLVIGLLAAFALGLTAFLLVEAHSQAPLLDLRLFSNRPFATGLLMASLVFLVLGGTGFLLPFYLEVIARFPASKVGLLLAISPIVGGVVAPFGGSLADRLGSGRVTLTGLSFVALGLLSFTTVDADLSIPGYAVRVVPIGLGMGLFNASNNATILNAVSRERLGIASALLSLMRTLGQTTGVPLIASVFALVALGHDGTTGHQALLDLPADSLVRGMRWANAVAACIVLFGLAAGVTELVRGRRAALSGGA